MQAWWAEKTYFKDIKKNLRLSIKVSLSMDFFIIMEPISLLINRD